MVKVRQLNRHGAGSARAKQHRTRTSGCCVDAVCLQPAEEIKISLCGGGGGVREIYYFYGAALRITHSLAGSSAAAAMW